MPSSLWLSGILYFFLEVRLLAHRRSSANFFVISASHVRGIREAASRAPPPNPNSAAISPHGHLAPPPRALPIRQPSRFLRLTYLLGATGSRWRCPVWPSSALRCALLLGARTPGRGQAPPRPSAWWPPVRRWDPGLVPESFVFTKKSPAPWRGGALRTVGLLAVAHMGLDAHPGLRIPQHPRPRRLVVTHPWWWWARVVTSPPQPWLRPPPPAAVPRQGFLVPLSSKTVLRPSRASVSLRPIVVEAPTISLAWSPGGRLGNRTPNRCLFPGCAAARLSPDSFDRAPWLVVRKQPVVARASRSTRIRNSFV